MLMNMVEISAVAYLGAIKLAVSVVVVGKDKNRYGFRSRLMQICRLRQRI